MTQDVSVQQNQITVNGSVELKEPADQATLTFSVKGVGSSLRGAVEQATDKMASLVQDLKAAQIDQKNISTSEFFSGENYGNKSLFSSGNDYRTIITAQVKVDSLNNLKTALYILAEKKVERVYSIIFSVKDEAGLRRRARIAAAQKAREKAEDIATALGVGVGKVLSVEEIQIKQPNEEKSNIWVAFDMSPKYPNPFNPVSTSNVDIPVLDESIGDDYFAQTVSSQSQVKVTFELK